MGVATAIASFRLRGMRTLLRRAIAWALLAASPLTMAASDSPIKPETLTCRFQASTAAGGRVMLHFTLRNAGQRDLHLLRWGSPFEGAWFGPFLQASTPLGELPFQGALRKRGDPAAQDYLLLRAGQSLSAELALNDAFALPPTGTLSLKASWHWHDVIAGGTPPRPRTRHQGRDQDCGHITLDR